MADLDAGATAEASSGAAAVQTVASEEPSSTRSTVGDRAVHAVTLDPAPRVGARTSP